MTATTTTLTDFLLARITEDENTAQSAGHGCGWLHEHNAGWIEVDLPAEHNVRPSYEMRFIRTFDPDRVLAECAAKRAIVGLMVDPDIDERGTPWGSGGYGEAYGDALRHLAAVYSDHADYDPSWAVS